MRAKVGAERRGRHKSRSRGVALVEFAFVAPVLFLLVFGIIEFGWAFLQYLDVRHGGREGARLAAVNAAPANGEADQASNIAREVCLRMEPNGSADVTIDLPGGTAIGDEVSVLVHQDLDTLTGFLDTFLDGVDLETEVHTRLEQEANFGEVTAFPC